MARIVIIGAGHNGLTCAAYLAKAGHTVTVFEQHRMLGGAARTDETTFPGYKISSCSYVCSLFMSEIVKDLDLPRHGYYIHGRNPSFFKPTLDGRFLSLGTDDAENHRQISKFDNDDADAYPVYNRRWTPIGEFCDSLIKGTPPRLPPRNILKWLSILGRVLKLGPRGMYRLVQMFTLSAPSIINSSFKSDMMRSAMLPDSTIGALDMSGLILILHQFMGDAGGARGVWGYQRGGMGGISKALASAAKEYGAEIHLNTPVQSILFDEKGVARGVRLEKKKGEVAADIVVSCATPEETFKRLVGIDRLPRSLRRRVDNDDYSSGVMKVNAILSGLPKFYALEGVENPEHYIKGTIHISPTVEYIESALVDMRAGNPSERPIVEVTIPSIVDDTLAPSGHHVMNMFVQYVPYRLPLGKAWTEERKEKYFRENVLGALRPFISNIDDILIGAQVLTPEDLEREFRLTRGNIFHGVMSWSRLFSLRYRYQSPIGGLYLCGSGTHPGGGVSGAPGYNAAHEILRTLKSA